MKKNYISPVLSELQLATTQLLANSITGVGGDSGLEPAEPTDPVPGEADAKGDWNIWD